MTFYEVPCHACNAAIGESCRDARGFVQLPHRGRTDALLAFDAELDPDSDRETVLPTPPKRRRIGPTKLLHDARRTAKTCINAKTGEPCYATHRAGNIKADRERREQRRKAA